MSGYPLTRLAKIVSCDVVDDPHGHITLQCEFCYGHEYQVLGYSGIDISFLLHFMQVCGKDALSKCKGTILWVTYDGTKITKLEPLPFEDDNPVFDIEEWSRSLVKKWSKDLKESLPI